MGKRGAEKQLTQDNWDRDEDEVIEGEGDFKAAAPEKLQQRKIKGLPGRKSASPAVQVKPASSTSSTQNAAGTQANGSTSKADQEAEKQLYISLRGLNVSAIRALQDLVDNDPFADLSERLKELCKRYCEERSKLSGKSAASIPNGISSKPAQKKQSGDKPPPKAAAFTDFSFAPTSSPSTSQSSTVPAETKKSTPPSSTLALPAVPSGTFSFAGKPVTSSMQSQKPASATGGFIFDASKSTGKGEKSAFSLPMSSAPPVSTSSFTPPSSAPSIPALGKMANAAPAKPSPLRTAASIDSSPIAAAKNGADSSAATADQSSKKPNAFSGFTFGSAASPSTSKSTPQNPATANASAPTSSIESSKAPAFSFGSPAATNSSATAKPTFGFGSSSPPKSSSVGFSFGLSPTSAATPSSSSAPEVNRAASSDVKPASAPSPFSFAPASASSTTSAFGASPFGTAKSASSTLPTFSFGSTAPSTTSQGLSASTSPFAFAMGSAGPASASTSTSAAASPAATAPKFSFSPAPSVGSPFAAPSPASDSNASGNEDPVEAKPGDVTENPFAKEGEGEQDEETLAEIRARMHVFTNGEWQQNPIGVFRVKLNKATGKTRILGRNATNSNVLVNFLLYPKFKMTMVGNKSATFIAFKDGERESVRLTVKDPTLLQAFKEAAESNAPP